MKVLHHTVYSGIITNLRTPEVQQSPSRANRKTAPLDFAVIYFHVVGMRLPGF